MRSISDTLVRMKASSGKISLGRAISHPSRLSRLSEWGDNPGALLAHSYVPEGLSRQAPLVVVLHGCTQTAAGYDHGSGWSQLADRHQFAVLYPEQQRANNPNLCFNWFVPGDIARGAGEVLSIAQMVRRMIELHDLDKQRVFITGLSAGGAMTTAMLATYPELFAGGAIIAGLPYGCATSIPEAFDRMQGHGLPSGRELETRVLGASAHRGSWPRLSIWHGTADQTVAQANMDAIVAQWRGLHGLQAVKHQENAVGLHTRRAWCDGAGTARIEAFSVEGIGHGTPLNSADDIGALGPFMLDAGISSTRHIARFWQLTETGSELSVPSRTEETPSGLGSEQLRGNRGKAVWEVRTPTSGVGKVIEDALRAAGLMR
ncbi:PHB depolymerase family esterase [Bosea sp. BK604]|uniref:extracellular catalytic domain type 1 short-chain-length polyhydroxyalkanoate depolymerase n=1 Tax=Bosea sp. BK604 TaxID=2512180 RepID=UPI0010477D00|nr:PHB depolymerase family esterase [Bosea sp. BK604]TCR68251.1 poly(hydroxyalkanoate) depolymerase family esterase [Bosea sp. BK604]